MLIIILRMVNLSVCQKHSIFVLFVFKERIPSVYPKHTCYSSYSCSKKKSIRVPKTFVLFELFVFKERIPSVCQKHSCYSSYSCSKKEFYPCAKNIRAIRAIRVQKKQSAQVPHTNAEPRRTTFILSVMPGDYHSHLPTRPLPLPHHITSQPSCHSQYTFHEASC